MQTNKPARADRLRRPLSAWTENEGCGDTPTVHDPACRDDRPLHGARDLWDERHQSDTGLLEVSKEGATMRAGFRALRADEICSYSLPSLGLRNGRCGTDYEAPHSLELLYSLRIEESKGKADDRRGQFQKCRNLRSRILTKLRWRRCRTQAESSTILR